MEEIKSKQGWRIIPLTLSDIIKLGGYGICDSCNASSFKFMYIGVLNSAYCQKCYEEWETTAKYYPEDVRIESKNIEYVKEMIS